MNLSTNTIHPLVSVITVVYNGEKYLEQTIQSVLKQTYKPIEYIIIDGGSTDGTLNIIQRHIKSITHWTSEPDQGIYDAWNKAVLLSKGEWIVFLGSDDLLLPNALSNYIDYIRTQALPELEYISSRVELVTEDLRTKRLWGSRWNWHQFKRYMNVAHVGSFHHRNLFTTYGLFDISYQVSGDYEFLLRAGNNLKTGFFDTVTAKMRVDGISSSNKQTFTETLRAKVETAKRAWLICYYEYLLAKLKHKTRLYLRRLNYKM